MNSAKDFVQFSGPFEIMVDPTNFNFNVELFQRFDKEIMRANLDFGTHGSTLSVGDVIFATPFRINRNVLNRREVNVPYECVLEFVQSNNGCLIGTLGLALTFKIYYARMRKTGMRFISPDTLERLPNVPRPSLCRGPAREVPYILGAEWNQFHFGSIQADLGLDGHCVVLLFKRG